jgi:hypothetical protein
VTGTDVVSDFFPQERSTSERRSMGAYFINVAIFSKKVLPLYYHLNFISKRGPKVPSFVSQPFL